MGRAKIKKNVGKKNRKRELVKRKAKSRAKKKANEKAKGWQNATKKGIKEGKAKSLNARNVKNNRHSLLFVRGPFERVPEAPPTLRRHYATITGQFVFEGIPSGKSHGYRDVIDFK